jgi:hypothetical protein
LVVRTTAGVAPSALAESRRYHGHENGRSRSLCLRSRRGRAKSPALHGKQACYELPMRGHRPWTARPTISVVCPTAHPGPLVAEALGSLRDAVDEIVIAADSRVEAADLGHYAAVADVLLRFEYVDCERAWPWLAAQARGDWLLLLDGDEVPSVALIGALRELVADRRIRQYSMPIHWPWPDPSRRLAVEPWVSGNRLRLLRNDGRLAFIARMHALAEPDLPICFLDELSVYHLDLLLSDRARREAKVARYDSEQPGLLTAEGLPFNEAFYLPEARSGELATIALPSEDAEAIARSLAAGYDETRLLEPSTLPLHSKAEVAWYAPRADLPPDAYRATLSLARPLPPFSAERKDHMVWVRVTNTGTARWPGGESWEPLVRLGVVWQPADGGSRYDAGRAFLPRALDPGEQALVPVIVCAPQRSGSAELVFDLVHEGARWFNCAVTAQVEVGPSAAERLGALVQKHGPLLPLAPVMRQRREIGARNCLLRDPAPGIAPTDRRIAKLMSSIALCEQTADAATIDRLVELVRAERPSTVVQFGGGISTLVLAALLAKLHGDEPRVVCFGQDLDGIGRTHEALAQRRLAHVVAFAHLPLGEPGDGKPACYVLTEEAAELLRGHPPEMVVVGGPTLDSHASRLGTVDLIAPFLHHDATLLLDDALHDFGLCVAQAWERRDDIVVHGIRPTARGLLEATLRAGSELTSRT